MCWSRPGAQFCKRTVGRWHGVILKHYKAWVCKSGCFGAEPMLAFRHGILGLSPSRLTAAQMRIWVEKLEVQAQANHDLADEVGVPEFVSNPYLLSFRPQAT